MLVCAGQVHASHDGTIHPHPEHDKKQQAAHLQLVPDVRQSEDQQEQAAAATKKQQQTVKKTKPKQAD